MQSPQGWWKVKYFDTTTLGAVLAVIFCSFLQTEAEVTFISALVGGVAGVVFTWAMKRRERPRSNRHSTPAVALTG